MNLSQYKDLAVPIASVLGAVLATLTTLKTTSGSRARLRDDVELLQKLEKGSEAHRMLSYHIEWQIHALGLAETNKSRVRFALFGSASGVAIFALFVTAINSGFDDFVRVAGYAFSALAIMGFAVYLTNSWWKKR